jgi:hypothetical protein
MRVIVPHTRSVDAAKQDVEQAVDKLAVINFPGAVAFTGIEKNWTGTTLNFSLHAAIGPLRSPIRGFAIVSDRDITIDIDLPKFLTALMPERTLESTVRGLLTK